MNTRQTRAGLFLERVDGESWLVDLGENPELVCIYGPYMNQRIAKEVLGDLPEDQIVLHATPTTHHDEHWDHPGRRSRISPNEINEALSLDGEVKDDCTFMMEGGLKMREESGGYLISQNNCAYFVNNEGARLVKRIGERVTVSDIRTLCEKHGIPEQFGMEFLRRLVTFGLYRPV